MTERDCYRCPSSATHYPRLYLHARDAADEPCTMTMLLELPTCAEHRSPFAESIILAANKSPLGQLDAQIAQSFRRRHQCDPDPLYTRIDWLSKDHAQVLRMLKDREERRERAPIERRDDPIAVEYVTFEDLYVLMAKAEDISVRDEEVDRLAEIARLAEGAKS